MALEDNTPLDLVPKRDFRMEEEIDLKAQIENGQRIMADLIWSILSTYNSFLLEMGHKRADLNAAAERFNRDFTTGKVTIRKRPEPRTTKPKVGD